MTGNYLQGGLGDAPVSAERLARHLTGTVLSAVQAAVAKERRDAAAARAKAEKEAQRYAAMEREGHYVDNAIERELARQEAARGRMG